MWKEMALVEFEIHHPHFPGWSEEKTWKTSVSIGSVVTETLIQD
jgi:hypothetical protein